LKAAVGTHPRAGRPKCREPKLATRKTTVSTFNKGARLLPQRGCARLWFKATYFVGDSLIFQARVSRVFKTEGPFEGRLCLRYGVVDLSRIPNHANFRGRWDIAVCGDTVCFNHGFFAFRAVSVVALCVQIKYRIREIDGPRDFYFCFFFFLFNFFFYFIFFFYNQKAL